MLTKIIIPFLLVVFSFSAFAQNEQAEYLEAKRLLSEKKYTSAKAAFGSLTESENFGKYASFYYALSAYQQGDIKQATDMWKQLISKYPRWDKNVESLFWLAYAHLENGQWEKGLNYASELTDKSMSAYEEEVMIRQFLADKPIEEIESLYETFPRNKHIARILLAKQIDQPYSERDIDRINQLVDQWGFEITKMGSYKLPVIKKDAYDIAILLPFLFQSLDDTRLIEQNRLVMDLYQGMQLAAAHLADRDIPVNLWPYDTKRSKKVTQQLIQDSQIVKSDLIVGPLYPGPNELISEFSFANQINSINPLSGNSDVIGDNPFAFLMQGSYETMARELALFAAQENDNPYTMIFYEQSERDSIFAAVYRETIEAEGFEVVAFQPINKENAKAVLDTLAAQYDTYLTKEEADSIRELPGRFVRDRRIRRDEIRRMQKDTTFIIPISYNDDNKAIAYYEKNFYMEPDSIGHILAATRSNLYANNLISAVETRSDSIKLYGYGEWLEFTMLSYNQLDRLGVALAYPEYYDKEEINVEMIIEAFKEKYKTIPSINHLKGYELIWFYGRMMHQYGRYFQNGLRSSDFQPGKIFEGFKYGASNDNQVVPIVRFKNSELQVENRHLYENREE